MYKKIFVIITLFFSIAVFNGCTQRNSSAIENIAHTEEPIHENVAAYEKDFAKTVIVDVSSQPSRNIYVTSPRMHGPEIKSLQERLVELGFIGIGEIDGFYGPLTAGEIYFIKAAVGFVDHYIREHDWQPEDYSVINEELWDIIFDPEKTIFLRSIGLIRLFNNDPQVHDPENNSNVTEFKETELPFTDPDWVPSWGVGHSSKVQREYYYNIGTNRISIIETIENAFVVRTTVRNFTFQNGVQITQSIYSEDSPITQESFSIP